MGILDALKGIFSGSGSSGSGESSAGFFFYVRCPSGHPIRVWVNRSSDLVQDFEGDTIGGYMLTKHIVCPRCYKKTRAEIRYDRGFRETSREIDNGRFIDASEYEAATGGSASPGA
jgi:hypothetical protein